MLRVTCGLFFAGWSLTVAISRIPQKTRSLTRLWSSNAGLAIHDATNPQIIALWKTSNVAMDKSTRLQRPAAEPVPLFVAKHASGGRVVRPSLVTAETAGLVLVARPTIAPATITVTRAVYVAVVACVDAATIWRSVSSSSMTFEVDVLQSNPSGTHGHLHLVSCTFTWPPATATRAPSVAVPDTLMATLAAAGATVVRDGSPLLALVKVDADTGTAGPYTARHDVPVKMMKYLRRERILAERLANADNSERQLGTVEEFMGLTFAVPSAALRPRPSSAALVSHAVQTLVRWGDDQLRVLDLGTGSGALLLSTIIKGGQLSPTPPFLAIDPPPGEDDCSVYVCGVGMDVDPVALAAAAGNAAAVGVGNRCQWVLGDFTRLHEPAVRAALAAALHEVAGRPDPDTADTSRDGMFDLIICNPPYLSSRAAKGRVTSEGALALVASAAEEGSGSGDDDDDDGLSAYRAICRSIAASLPSTDGGPDSTDADAWLRMPLLRPNGLGAILFQTPGGERGCERVKDAVEGLGLGWKVDEIAEDLRGVRRSVLVAQAKKNTHSTIPGRVWGMKENSTYLFDMFEFRGCIPDSGEHPSLPSL